MAKAPKDIQEGMKRLEEHFGSRVSMLGFTLGHGLIKRVSC
jgi:hypothetical protein